MKKTRLLSLFIAFTTGFSSFVYSAQAKGSQLNIPAGERTVTVIGPVGNEALALANKVERLSAKSQDPIYFVINSPGGSVLAGLQLIQAIDIARSRGVKVVCAVGNIAASMAFQLLPHCSERYALPNSLLLFHPSRVFLMFATLTAEQAGILAREMAKIDRRGLDDIAKMMQPKNRLWLLMHYSQETMWTATDLVAETNDKWLNIVDDINYPDGIFSLEEEKGKVNDKSKVVKEARLKKLPYIIVNQR